MNCNIILAIQLLLIKMSMLIKLKVSILCAVQFEDNDACTRLQVQECLGGDAGTLKIIYEHL